MELCPPPLKLIVGCLVPDRVVTKSPESGPWGLKKQNQKRVDRGIHPHTWSKKGERNAPLFHNVDLLVGIARLHLGGLRTNRERILLSRKSDLVQGFLAVGIDHGYR
jgi:hypothetical protein